MPGIVSFTIGWKIFSSLLKLIAINKQLNNDYRLQYLECANELHAPSTFSLNFCGQFRITYFRKMTNSTDVTGIRAINLLSFISSLLKVVLC